VAEGHSDHTLLEVDVLGFKKVVQPLRPVQAAEARLAVAAGLALGEQAAVAVQPDGAGTDGAGDPDGAVEVASVEAGGEAVAGGVRLGDGLGLVDEALDRGDGAEQLLLDQRRVGIFDAEECRCEEGSGGARPARIRAAQNQLALPRPSSPSP
jgi:hypothetical protein